MMRCPLCGIEGHTREATHLEDGSKETIVQCRNVYCSATFVTLESFFMAVESVQQPRINGKSGWSQNKNDVVDRADTNTVRGMENGSTFHRL